MEIIHPIIISAGVLTDYEGFTILCYDGWAVGSNGSDLIQWRYPSMNSLTKAQINAAMEHRFGSDWRNKVVPNCEDIFMKYGEIDSTYWRVTPRKPEQKLWARKCDATGQGMNEGYVFGDGDKYFSVQSAASDYAQELGYKDLDEAYEDEAYYWTEWEDESEYQYMEVNGELIEIQ